MGVIEPRLLRGLDELTARLNAVANERSSADSDQALEARKLAYSTHSLCNDVAALADKIDRPKSVGFLASAVRQWNEEFDIT